MVIATELDASAWQIDPEMMTSKQLSAGICTGTLWLILLLAALPNTSRADCACVCVEGAVQAVCDNNVEPSP
jgi:hypothetical protein